VAVNTNEVASTGGNDEFKRFDCRQHQAEGIIVEHPEEVLADGSSGLATCRKWPKIKRGRRVPQWPTLP
jgi:hypothetical protein